uniref:Uncharacterized protein n=2 Tax=Gossypium TaxID=3633 RepID=A0A0D2VXD8_GOSRA|nr:hypothetical protein B456_012G091900 [Gossypium raimondii]
MREQFKDTRAQYIVIIFYKLQYFMQNGPATQLGSFPSAWIHKTYFLEVSSNPYNYKDLQKYLCQVNRTIPIEIWPLGDVLAPWDIKIEPPTPYQKQLKKALEEYQSNIPDPKECDGLEQQIKQMEIKCYRAKEEKVKMIEELNLTSDVSTDYESD